MDWNQTRKKLLQLSSVRFGRAVTLEQPAPLPMLGWGSSRPAENGNGRPAGTRAASGAAVPGREPRAGSLCIASGKGGTGKSIVTASLAALLAPRGRTLIVDADLGVGNAHILQDVSPPRTFVDVVEGSRTVREVLVRCSERIDLLAGGSGVPRMADLSTYEMHLVATGLAELEGEYGYLLVDSAAGVSKQTLAFARASDVTLVVTTPDLTAMTDAYAFLKVLLAEPSHTTPLLLVNRVRGEEEALEVQNRIGRVCERFLGQRPQAIGWIPDDPCVREAVNQRSAVALSHPDGPATAALRRTAVSILEELARRHAAGLGHSLLEDVGYSHGLS